MASAGSVSRFARRVCYVCHLPSIGKKHQFCEFPSTKGAKGVLSKVYHYRRHAAKRELSRKAASV